MIKQLFLLLIGGALGAGACHYYCPPVATNKCTDKAYVLHTAEQKLWADHVVWSRDYIIAGPDHMIGPQFLFCGMQNVCFVGTFIGSNWRTIIVACASTKSATYQ